MSFELFLLLTVEAVVEEELVWVFRAIVLTCLSETTTVEPLPPPVLLPPALLAPA